MSAKQYGSNSCICCRRRKDVLRLPITALCSAASNQLNSFAKVFCISNRPKIDVHFGKICLDRYPFLKRHCAAAQMTLTIHSSVHLSQLPFLHCGAAALPRKAEKLRVTAHGDSAGPVSAAQAGILAPFTNKKNPDRTDRNKGKLKARQPSRTSSWGRRPCRPRPAAPSPLRTGWGSSARG